MKAAVIILALAVSSFVAVASEPSAKDLFKQGENCLKASQVFEAYNAFVAASLKEPSSKKYQSKVLEVGRMASKLAEAEGRRLLATLPTEAHLWFQRAVVFDKGNSSAAEALVSLDGSIGAARESVKSARAALLSGDFEKARQLLESAYPYRERIREFQEVQGEVEAVQRVKAVVELWDANKYESALGELSAAEAAAPKSPFAVSLFTTIKQKIAALVITRAEELPVSLPIEVINRAKLTALALGLDGGNRRALEMQNQNQELLANRLLGSRDLKIPSLSRASASRVALEKLEATESLINFDARFSSTKTKLSAEAFPFLRTRVIIGELSDCPVTITKQKIQSALIGGLGRVVQLDNEKFDVTLNVKGVSCSSRDVPRQSVQPVNSTFVAGHSQTVNPEYIQLQARLTQAKEAYFRKEQEIKSRPSAGFFGGMADSMALSSARQPVTELEQELSRTPPFNNQDILQPYQFEKYEAYRSFEMGCKLQLRFKGSEATYGKSVLRLAESRGDGVSGVLPSDSIGASNKEPKVNELSELRTSAEGNFLGDLSTASKELLAGLFAVRASDPAANGGEKIASLLYLTDLAEGTSYESLKPSLHISIANALLSAETEVREFKVPDALPVPERAQVIEPSNPVAVDAESMIERAMRGVVSVESDKGSGTGFFVSGCLVVTNAHVIEGAGTVTIRDQSKQSFLGRIVAQDVQRDLALLRTETRACSPLTLDQSSSPALGSDVFAIGNPLGLTGTVTKGIVSALRTTTDGTKLVQIDAPINQGNSGGPLINRQGLVIGVNAFKFSTANIEGIGFAIRSSEIMASFGKYFQ